MINALFKIYEALLKIADNLPFTNHPYRCKVYLSSTWNMPNGSGIVPFDSEEYDDNSDYDTTNYEYVCPKDGLYLVTYRFKLNSPLSNTIYLIHCHLDGSSVCELRNFDDIDGYNYASVQFKARAGQKITFSYYQNSGTTIEVNSNKQITSAEITLLSL
jgi:hypothetical protein